MINWLAQGLLDSAGFVASCFITRDAPQFGVMQGAVAIVLLVSIVAVLACWPGPFRSTSFTKMHKNGLAAHKSDLPTTSLGTS